VNPDRRISDAVIEELRARLPIQDLVGRLTKLRRSGRAWRGRCVFCDVRSEALIADPSPDKRTFHCFACGAHGDILTWLMRTEGCSFRQAVARAASECGMPWEEAAGERAVTLAAPKQLAPARDIQKWRADAAERWAPAVRIEPGSVVARYLDSRRLWPLPEATHDVLRATMAPYPSELTEDDAGKAVRRWPGGRKAHPVMIARISAPGVALTAVHCTFLEERADGTVGKLTLPEHCKAKRYFGPLPAGSAIRLFPPAERMGIAEGIETALSAAILNGGLPVWAAGDAGGVAKWIAPRVCRVVDIFADRDKPRFAPQWRPEGQGMHDARTLQRRMRESGRDARIWLPDEGFGDFADILESRERVAA
jgi:putative DNA primase/helicase